MSNTFGITTEALYLDSDHDDVQGRIDFSLSEKNASSHLTFVDLNIELNNGTRIRLERVDTDKLRYACREMEQERRANMTTEQTDGTRLLYLGVTPNGKWIKLSPVGAALWWAAKKTDLEFSEDPSFDEPFAWVEVVDQNTDETWWIAPGPCGLGCRCAAVGVQLEEQVSDDDAAAAQVSDWGHRFGL